MWREPNFAKLQQIINAVEKAAHLQAEVDMDKLMKLKAVLVARAKEQGIEIPKELLDETEVSDEMEEVK